MKSILLSGAVALALFALAAPAVAEGAGSPLILTGGEAREKILESEPSVMIESCKRKAPRRIWCHVYVPTEVEAIGEGTPGVALVPYSADVGLRGVRWVLEILGF